MPLTIAFPGWPRANHLPMGWRSVLRCCILCAKDTTKAPDEFGPSEGHRDGFMPPAYRFLSKPLFRTADAAFIVSGIWAANLLAAEDPSTVLVTGSSRGMGLEFARQYADKGWRVIATCRNPAKASALHALAASRANVIVEEMDVTDDADVDALAKKYENTPIDVLLNNAGIFGYEHLQTLDVLDYETFVQVMAVNVYGQLKVSQAFANSVAASQQKKIVTLTSGLGSMSLTEQRGGRYFYRASKAGANIIGRTLAADLRDQGILVGLFNPGIVNTEFLKWTSYHGPTIEPEEAVGDVIGLIENLNEGNNALMTNHDGAVMHW